MEGRPEEILHGQKRHRIALDDMGVLERDQGDEQPDPRPHGVFQRHGDGVDDLFADGTGRQQKEDDALHRDREQRQLPRIAHGVDDGIGEKGVQPHGRSQHQRAVGPERHAERADECRQRRGEEAPAPVHAGAGEDVRIHGQNVGDRQKRDQPGIDLPAEGRAVFMEFETSFPNIHPASPRAQ